MLPLKLTIEGLYSYQTKQTIDFSELTQAGLFGIFGAVGSGKSSILEAVSFALYGETERMNQKDGRAYNMMNLRSNKSYIEFDFLNYENKKFRAVREFRRNSKRFDDVKIYNTCFYEEKNNEWIPLEHTNASEILGLSYENFKRTIIIPQGQFKEFLELGASERTKMMKEIFSLHRFDLQEKVSELSKNNELILAEINGKIGGFEEVSEVIIDEKQQQFLIDKASFLEIEKQFQKIDEEFQKLKLLKTDCESLNQKKNELKSFSEREMDFKAKEAKLELFEKVERNFKALLDEEKRLQTESGSLTNELVKESEELIILKSKLDELQKKFDEIKPLFDALEMSKQNALDLEFIIKIQEAKKEIETLALRIEKGKSAIDNSKINEENISKNFEILNQNHQKLRSEKKDTQVLMQVGEWFSAKRNLDEKRLDLQKKSSLTFTEINSLNQKLAEVSTLSKEEIEREVVSLNQKKSEFQNQKNQLQVSEKLSQFANELEAGKPCPLCGSPDHPNVSEIHNLTEELADLEIKINANESQIKTCEKQILDIKALSDQKLFFENQKKEYDLLIYEVVVNLKNHISNFIWKDFDKDNFQDFEDQRKSSIELEKQISESEKLLDEERKKLDFQQKETLRFEDLIKKIKDDFLMLETSEAHYKSQIKSLNIEDYKDSEIEILQSNLESLNIQNLKTAQDYKLFNDEIFAQTPKVSAKENSVKTLEKRKIESAEFIIILKEKIADQLKNHQFESVDFVKRILAQNLDISKERKEIQDFYLELKILKNDILHLEEKLKEVEFSEEIYAQKQKELEESNSVKNEKQKLLNVLESEILRLKKSFDEKKELLKEQSGLQKRGENLSTMLNLFRGNGFVQYISSIYLKQLCDNANIRFHRMTRNQLSLQVNDRNEFEIIDYLNEGKTRSVKTLSGGQSFQVSLSLALALAESVQSQAVSDRNFFFIDEGFGTQDPESVNLVFETLNNLRNENRIVGIISHVEELKEKIPISLNITKDEETGSRIEVVVN